MGSSTDTLGNALVTLIAILLVSLVQYLRQQRKGGREQKRRDEEHRLTSARLVAAEGYVMALITAMVRGDKYPPKPPDEMRYLLITQAEPDSAGEDPDSIQALLRSAVERIRTNGPS